MAKIKSKGKRWVVDYYSGGVRSRPVFETRREAEEFKRKLLLGDNAPPTSKTIRQAIEDYELNFSALKASHKNESAYLKTFLNSMSAKKLIYPHQIELIHLQSLQRELLKNVSGSTVNRQFNTYKHFIEQCDLWGYITKNPLKGLKKMAEDPKRKTLWTKENIEHFFSSLETQWHKDLAFLFSRTTSRPIELLRLMRGDYNKATGELCVKVFKGNGEARIIRKKLNAETCAYIDGMLKRKRSTVCKNLIVNDDGEPITANAAKVAMARAISKAGLEGLNFYAIKHTVASLLRAQHTDVETIRQVLGHTKLSTTQAYLQNLEGSDLVRDALNSVFK